MALVQRAKVTQQTTFEDVADLIFKMAINEASLSTRLDIVFDRYWDKSIKYPERVNRGSGTCGLKVQNVAPRQMIKQWRKFLSEDANKTSLIKFLADEWRGEKYQEKLAQLRTVVYFTYEERCFRLTGVRCLEVPELQCWQEEADGRMLLHAHHAVKEGYEAVVLSSEDTDVFVLSLACSSIIPAPLFQKKRTPTRTHLIDVKQTAESLGSDVCEASVGMHAYTGCDSVSAFGGKGKGSTLKTIKTGGTVRRAFCELGQSWEVTDELFQKLESFTCRLYAPRETVSDVSELRYRVFCAKNGDVESHQLPPCKDGLRKHAMRANYQTALWRRCLMNNPECPEPTDSGWVVECVDGKDVLTVNWMTVALAPSGVLELLACVCKKECNMG